ncbi:hypothetical protein N9M74_00370 [Pontimonas sp.]|nr:hypothetical protein [Pontimonas sp.]
MGRLRFTFTPPGQRFGMGHYSRVLALAQSLDTSGPMSEAIRDAVNVVSRNSETIGWTTIGDFEWEGTSSWWVFDLCEGGQFMELRKSLAKERGFRTLVVDHLHQIFTEVDVHIVPSPVPTSPAARVTRQYFGWEFVLSRFGGGLRPLVRSNEGSAKGVALTGGTDSLKVLPIWLETFVTAKQRNLTFDVVRGRFARVHTLEYPKFLNVLDGSHEYPESFASYSLGLSVHGVTTFDLLVSGVPVVIVPNPQIPHRQEALSLAEMGIAIVEDNPKAAASVFLETLGDSTLLLKMHIRLAKILETRNSFSWIDFLKSL